MRPLRVMCLGTLAFVHCAHAQIEVAGVSDPTVLAEALFIPGDERLTLIGASGQILTAQLDVSSAGLLTHGPLPNNYTLDRDGIVLSTGDAPQYVSGPNDQAERTHAYAVFPDAEQRALLDSIVANPAITFEDPTDLIVTFTSCRAQQIVLEVVFGSEEFPEYVDADPETFDYVDTFGAFLNGANIAIIDGEPLSVDADLFEIVEETELDGVQVLDTRPVLRFLAHVNSGTNELRFLLADVGDARVDTTVYIQQIHALADFNADGAVGITDLLDFLDLYFVADPGADIASPFGEVGITDLLAFLDDYLVGCPQAAGAFSVNRIQARPR